MSLVIRLIKRQMQLIDALKTCAWSTTENIHSHMGFVAPSVYEVSTYRGELNPLSTVTLLLSMLSSRAE